MSDTGALTTIKLAWQALKVTLAHYRKAPLQAGAILLGIVLAVTLLIGVKATNDNAINSYREAGEALGQQASLFITPKARGVSLDEALYFQLRQSGIQALPVISGVLDDAQGRQWQVEGSDIIAALGTFEQRGNGRNHLPLNRLLAGEPIIVMSDSLHQGLKAPSTLSLGGRALEVQALADSQQLGNRLYLDISLAQQLLKREGTLSYIALFGEPQRLKERLKQSGLPLDKLNISEQDKGAALTALTRSFHLNLNAMGMLAFVVGLFIAYNGVRYSLMKRRRLLLLLLKQGLGRRALMLALLLELLLLVFIGSASGFILALQLSQWLQPMVALTLEQLYGATLLPGNWRWQWLAEGAGLTLIAALLACVPLYLELCHQSLAQNTQSQWHAHRHRSMHKRLFLMGGALLALTALLYPLSQTHQHSLGLMGLLTLAIPLLLPQLLQSLLGLLARLFPSGLSKYAIADTRELVAPLALAMMALLLALCANIAMNTLVGSFDKTLRSWLDTRLHAELYIRPGAGNMAKLEHFLEQQAPGLAHFYQWQAPFYAKGSGNTLEINLISRDADSIARTTALKTPAQAPVQGAPNKQQQALQTVIQGQALAISEPLALMLGLAPGDKLSLCPEKECKTPLILHISAIYYDYGNPKGEVLLAQSLWQELKLPTEAVSLAVSGIATSAERAKGAGLTSIAALERALIQELGLSPVQVYSQQKIRDEAIRVFNKTFSITLVLNTLTLLVAAVGLFSAVLMLTQSRQASLAMLRSLGLTRGRLLSMLLLQMLLVVLLTCLLALPMGAILGYLLIHKVTLQAFGWTIAMQWDWLAYGRVVLLSLLCCILAVIVPLYWQSRRSLVSSLQQEVL
ncbi:FtsX-like permease family protein [Shewanella algae]|uniref:FtsX-like permease family protein n=1 Tax=Shewanella algae TaxID=38313 RepID=UPI001AAEC356|nr:ABC transporter permease [Shewanella algae]MBO2634180.1 ABC transporter permease [Shewanella algae]MDO8253387.1 ABC transporter permease [Shewanella algae]